jgi:hypothetical protein
MVGAPVSVDSVFLVGPDQPMLVGKQFAVGFAGAAATAVGILFGRYWRWLLGIGAVGVVFAHAIRVPRAEGVRVQVAGSNTGVSDIVAHPLWMAVLVMGTAVLLVGVLGVAQELLRDNRIGASVAGFAGCAAYFGVGVTGRLRGASTAPRLIVVIVAAAVVIVAVLRLRESGSQRGQWVSMVAAAAALVWMLPTMIVAIRGQQIFGTVLGGIVGLAVLAVALLATRPAGQRAPLAVLATGLVLGPPVVMLVLLYDVPFDGVWYGWPIALAGVLLGAGAAGAPTMVRAGIVAAAGLSMLGVAADNDNQLIIWLFLALIMAAVATTVGAAARVLAQVDAAPALAALGTLAALGVFGSLNLFRVGGKTLASTGNWVSALLVLLAAGLVATTAVRSGRSATTPARQSR